MRVVARAVSGTCERVRERGIMFDTAQVGFGQNEVHSLMLLVTFLGAAVLCDLQDRRVPNVLVALMLVAGVVTQALTAPSIGSGLLAAFGGAGLPGASALPGNTPLWH